MLAARDQENLIHAQQQAAAGKPLNQGVRQLQPKTPGNRAPKTPFRVPLNDENGSHHGAGKSNLKTNGRAIENSKIQGKKSVFGDKDAFVTPMGPRANRAPLGAKSTNAKARALPTPGDGPVKDGLVRSSQRKPTVRQKPRTAELEKVKVDVLGDDDDGDVPDIEYCPPRPKALPDIPDDLEPINLDVLRGANFARGWYQHYLHMPEEDGTSLFEKEQKKLRESGEREEKRNMAKMNRDFDLVGFVCPHNIECPGECLDFAEHKAEVEKRYEEELARIDGKPASKYQQARANPPSTASSRSAARALSQQVPKPAVSRNAPAAKAKAPAFASSMLPKGRKTPPATNPSSMRHSAAVAASKTTLGYAKGRSASAQLRPTAKASATRPKFIGSKGQELPDTSLPPAQYLQRYGPPPRESQLYALFERLGCFDSEPEREGEGERWQDDLFREEAERDVELTLDF